MCKVLPIVFLDRLCFPGIAVCWRAEAQIPTALKQRRSVKQSCSGQVTQFSLRLIAQITSWMPLNDVAICRITFSHSIITACCSLLPLLVVLNGGHQKVLLCRGGKKIGLQLFPSGPSPCMLGTKRRCRKGLPIRAKRFGTSSWYSLFSFAIPSMYFYAWRSIKSNHAPQEWCKCTCARVL